MAKLSKYHWRHGVVLLLLHLAARVAGQFDCSFDDDLCGWTQDPTHGVDWTSRSGPTPTSDTGPSGDHTTGQGQYMYVETTQWDIPYKSARLISPPNQAAGGGTKCFQFYYHMYGSGIGTLRVYVARADAELPVGNETWTMSGSQGDQWHLWQIDITRPDSDPFVVTIEAYVTVVNFGDTAIDDVTIFTGFCPEIVVTPSPSALPSLTKCDFEPRDYCGYWQQNSTDQAEWYRNQGPTQTSNTGPSTDHTYSTSQGNYMYIEATSPWQQGDSAQLWSTPFPAEGGHCVEFFYHMYGEDMGTMNVYAVPAGGDIGESIKPVWTRAGDQGDMWNIARVQATLSGDFQVVFEGILGGDTSDMAIDDVIVSDVTCHEQGDCNFEDDVMCTWTNEQEMDDFDWLRRQGGADKVPEYDHTLQTAEGHYMYMNSDGLPAGNTTRLNSQSYVAVPGTRRCVTFWYFIEGVGVGSLTVRQMTTVDGDVARWRVGSSQGAEWRFGQVAISQDQDYTIVFQGEVGTSTSSSVALDDVVIRDNGCRVIPHGAEVGPVLPSTALPPSTQAPVTVPPGPANCDFENDLCSYTLDTGSADFLWTRRREPTETPNTGPDNDHTFRGTNPGAGWYMYTEADGQFVGDAARLISGAFTPQTASCFTFWYHMQGSQMGTLNVKGNEGAILWSRTGEQGDQWTNQKINIAMATDSMMITIEGVMTGGAGCDMAIDDLQLLNQPCDAGKFCDFELGIDSCGYEQETLFDNFDWIVGQGETPTRYTGPWKDHTTDSMEGNYVFIEADGRNDTDVAWLQSPVYQGAGAHCVKFYYYLYGEDIGTLNLFYRKENMLSLTLFSRSGDHGKQWNVARVDLDITDEFRLVFSASVTDGPLGDIALDDITMETGACPPLGTIDFENGFEVWTNDPSPSDDFEWIIGSGSTLSPNTGPDVDHTYGTAEGHYAFTEVTDTLTGFIARLRSPLLPPTPPQGRCMTFWFHMKGQEIGNLKIILQAADGSANVSLWDYGDNLGDHWQDGQVPLSSNVDYWVVLEGTDGGDEGDIALDDLSFNEEICGVSPPIADPNKGSTTVPPATATSTPPLIQYNCNFDTGLCDFTQPQNDDFDWTRNNGATLSQNTGPTYDHTTDTYVGYYMYTESSAHLNQRAWLETPAIPSAWGDACIAFWYHMWGEAMGTLNVYARINATYSDLVLTRTGSYGNRWLQTHAHYDTNADFNFVFEGIVTDEITSDMAIDDVFITQGPCPGQHICDFEDASICGYTQDLLDDFDWSWGQGPTETLYTGPSLDVTTGTELGHYIYIDASSQTPGDKARILTTEFNPDENSTNICWSFYFHMYGDQMGSLNVMLDGDQDPQWTAAEGLTDRWYYGELSITRETNYQVVFEGVVGAGERGDIALDDVDYAPGTCSFGSCSFEDEFCEWFNIGLDNFDWIKASGRSDGFGNTGPNNDHTLGTAIGYYMLADATGRTRGDTALLHLGAPQLQGARCLNFWYMMRGAHVGELMVFASDRVQLSVDHVVWMLYGDQDQDGDEWRNGTVTIDFDEYRDVYIMVEMTDLPYADIAIDDLSLTEGDCPFYPPEASPDYTFKPLACDFEQDLCSWKQAGSSDDDFDWQRATSTFTGGTGPDGDHTTGDGYFLYTISQNHFNELGRLTSPIQSGGSQSTMCFQLYYHMLGRDMGTFQIKWRAENGEQEETIFRRDGDQGNLWNLAKAEIVTDFNFEIQIEGIVGDGTYSDMAIDDISATPGFCPPARECTFEHDFCDWSQEEFNDDFDWSRGRGEDYPDRDEPLPDHSTGTISGSFIFVNHSSGVAPGSTARLHSGTFDVTAEGDCMVLWYHQSGASTLRVWERVEGDLVGPYWESQSGTQPSDWMEVRVTVKATTSFQVVLEAEVGPSNDAELAVDDIIVNTGPCLSRGFCDFETDQCLWSNVPEGDDLDWIREQGNKGSGLTAPEIDHTKGTGNGWYMLLVVGLNSEGKTAWLVSDNQAPTDGCFQLWYHMAGSGVGSLTLYTENLASGVRAAEWNQTGDQGENWLLGQVSLYQATAFSFVIEGTVGSGIAGDIAIDDVFFIPGQTCNDTSPVNCDFQSDFCGYTQDAANDFNWVREQEDQSVFAATDETGWYIYAPSDGQLGGDMARIQSPPSTVTMRQCLNFWYRSPGPAINTLNVYVRRSDADNSSPGALVWSRGLELSYEWVEVQISIVEAVEFHIIFEAVIEESREGDIALDDISLHHGYCKGTATCNFEDPFICGYVQDDTDSVDWVYWSGETPTPNTGPSVDVTYGTSFGHYLYIAERDDQPISQTLTARLFSPRVTSTNPDEVHCWRYFYHMYGQDVYALEFSAADGSQRTRLATHLYSQGDAWQEAAVQVNMAGYSLVIEAYRRDGAESDIAIDAITFSKTGCNDCDFESGWCGWLNAEHDEGNWQRRSGDDGDTTTGPADDHTKQNGNGFYIYTDGELFSQAGDTAILNSTVATIHRGEATCLSFWYLMYGADVGELRIYVSTDFSRDLTWTLSGQQSSDSREWLLGRIPYQAGYPSYEVQFEFWSIRGNGPASDIALDDFKVSLGDCDLFPPSAVYVSTTPLPPTTTPPAPTTQECDFETDFCGFVQATDDDFLMSWIRRQGPTPTDNTGPSVDHTLGTEDGYYIHVEGSQNTEKRARLESALFPVTMAPACISFWYHMYGAGMGEVNLYAKEGDALGGALWTRRGSLGDRWHFADVQVNDPTSNYRIVFEGFTGQEFTSDMALDDISIVPEACPATGTCTFEDADLCNFIQHPDNVFDWTWGSGATPTPFTGPFVDVTYGTSTGHYMYAMSAGNQWQTARLLSNQIAPSDGQTKFCLTFYYHMFGSDIGSLGVKIQWADESETPRKWEQGGENLGDRWYWAQLGVTAAQPFRVMFEGSTTDGDEGDIAIDDVTIAEGQCGTFGSCDFENGSCAWENTERDDLDWIVKTGSAGFSSGPLIDHTIGEGGHYLFLDSSHPALRGMQGALLLAAPPLQGPHCLGFWYLMYGPAMGQLLVYTALASDLATRELVWRLEGQQSTDGADWLQATLTVDFDIIDDVLLVGMIGSPLYSHIALDDITINDGNCTFTPAMASPDAAFSLVDCTFEDGECYYQHDPDDDFSWTRWRGATTTPNTGPSLDHTIDTGWYMYTNARFISPGSVARLQTPLLHQGNSSSTCLQFYFHMYGASMGDLNVYLTKTELNQTQTLWTRAGGDYGDVWHLGQVDVEISSSDGLYRIIFEGVRGSSSLSDLALDDITYRNGSCPPLRTCFLEGQLCGWTQEPSTDQFDWTHDTASSLRPSLGDHSTGTASGYILYADHGVPQVEGDTALLYSPTYDATATGDCFTFWYHQNGNGGGEAGYLAVHEVVEGALSGPYWWSSIDQGDQWLFASVTLRSTSPFQIAIEAMVGANPSTELAIDDLTVTEQACPPRGFCDFEGGYCTWNNDETGDDSDWTRAFANSVATGTGPAKDHTTGSKYGYYLFTDATWMAADSVAWLQSEVHPAGDVCFTFWYHMYGADVGSLTVYTEDEVNTVRSSHWSLSGDQGNRWIQATVSLSHPNPYRIILESLSTGGDSGDIALDDTMISEGGLCNASSTIDCDFEDDWCDFTQSSDDSFDWQRQQWSAPVDEVGPTFDHTTKTDQGFYIFVAAPDDFQPADEARIDSPIITMTTRQCLHFWYHMVGKEAGVLNVRARRVSAGQTEEGTLLWTAEGPKGDQWVSGKLVVGEPTAFQLIFQGIPEGNDGTIALDDIHLYAGDCERTLGCEFEDEQICGYLQDAFPDDFDWTRWSGDTPTANTGPSNDTTYGTSYGHYMYLEASGQRNQGDSAWLTSPHVSMETTQTVCWRFSYHMYGSDVFKLEVYYQTSSGLLIEVSTLAGNKGDQWQEHELEITDNGYEVVFVGTIGDGEESDIAIDSIRMTPGRCIECDFERSMCGWVNGEGYDDFDWMRWRGPPDTPDTGPLYDHTMQTEAGFYLLMDATNQNYADEATIWNHFDTLDETDSCFTFWVHMLGRDVGSLELTIGDSVIELIWRLEGWQSADRTTWIQGQIPFTGRSFLVFTGKVGGGGDEGDIALDDFSYTPGYCQVLPTRADMRPPTTTPLPATTLPPTPSPYSCDFEVDFCTFEQDQDDDFQWTRRQGATPSSETGPTRDHTTGAGFYVYAEASFQYNALARLQSDTMSGVFMSPICIDFWYHMYGTGMGTLSVRPRVFGGLFGPIWSRSGNQGDRWNHAQIDYTNMNNYEISFEAQTLDSDSSDIALDDINIYKGACPGMHECDFETNALCGYTQDAADDFDWSWGMGATDTDFTGPSIDVTYGTAAGHYLYIDASEQTQSQAARISTPELIPSPGETDFCWSFFYHMFGENIGTLNIYIEGDSTPAWSLSSENLGDSWFYTTVNISNFVTYKLTFEGIVGNGDQGDIAIDQVDYKVGACDPPGSCDFESGMCSWQNVGGDDFDWLRNNGGTNNFNTGPYTDHTTNTGDGFYMFTESSSPQTAGNEALLYLGIPSLSRGRCLQFWYHMYGAGMGELAVYAANSSLSPTDRFIWRLGGPQQVDQYAWLFGQVPVDFDQTSELYFAGVIGSDKSDMAIDDIYIAEMTCNVLPAKAAPGTGIESLSCDFDDDNVCSWRQDRADDFNWLTRQGETDTDDTGPEQDHSGDGYYAYIKAADQAPGDVARLLSPSVDTRNTTNLCLTFYYHMRGSGMGRLNVRWEAESGSQELIYTVGERDMGDVWNEASASVAVPDDTIYWVVFEGIRGQTEYGDFAIDDILVFDGYCLPSRTCDFELGFCAWQQEATTDDFDWSRDMGSDVPHGDTDFIDHTTGTVSGHFIYVDHSSPLQPGDRALLYSSSFDATPTGDCMSFWYHLASEGAVGTLRVWERINGTLVGPYWTSSPGMQPIFWMNAALTVKAESSFEVVLEATTGATPASWMAVDDISFDRAPCKHPGLCDFEDGYCSWLNTNDGDDADWALVDGDTTSTRPKKDHTLGTSDGHYVYVDPTSLSDGQTAWLLSDIFPPTDSCFKFWYYISGAGGALNIYVQDQASQARALEWMRDDHHDNRWVEGQLSVSTSNSFLLVLEATDGTSGTIAIDDTFITQTGLCNDTSTMACDFEDGWCLYEQDNEDDLDWERDRASDASTVTLINTDHTTGTADGYYIHIGTTSATLGSTARLNSPLAQPSARQCLTFWYFAVNQPKGTLNVYSHRSDVMNMEVLEWRLSQTQSYQWLQGMVELTQVVEYSLIFEGVYGIDSGTIAIDDIGLIDGSCPATSTCEFESPLLCGYRQDEAGDDFNWDWGTGPTLTPNTGPLVDVTYGTSQGHFMFIESSRPNERGDTARLISPHMSHDQDTITCWSFYYHMHGRTMGQLEIIVNDNQGFERNLATIAGDQGNDWLQTAIEVYGNGYELIFKGVVGDGEESDIAIDSVQVVDRSCLGCDFEDDWCSWENSQDDTFNWVRQMGPTPSPGTGPLHDHTRQHTSGYYVYIEGDSPQSPGDVAKLYTTFYSSSSASEMCFSFWYHMFGSEVGTLELYKNENVIGIESLELVWSLTGQQSSGQSQWLEGRVPYTKSAQFEFWGIIGSGPASDIALDDLHPISGDCAIKPPSALIGTTVAPPIMSTTGKPSPRTTKPTAPTPETTSKRQTDGVTMGTKMQSDSTTSAGRSGPDPLVISLSVIAAVIVVFAIIAGTLFYLKYNRRNKFELQNLSRHMENPAYDPDKPVELAMTDIEPQLQKSPLEDGFENPSYVRMDQDFQTNGGANGFD